MDIIQELKHQLKVFVVSNDSSMSSEDVDAKVDDLYVEAAMVVASYNMVSRFLLATDVAGISDMEVPWPVDKKEVSILSMIPSPLFMRLITVPRSQIDKYYIICQFLSRLLPELSKFFLFVLSLIINLNQPVSLRGVNSEKNEPAVGLI